MNDDSSVCICRRNLLIGTTALLSGCLGLDDQTNSAGAVTLDQGAGVQTCRAFQPETWTAERSHHLVI